MGPTEKAGLCKEAEKLEERAETHNVTGSCEPPENGIK